MTPRRDSKGRFVARVRRRNPDGAMFRDAEGRLHPIRSWAGYDQGKMDEQTKPPKKTRRPKAGTVEERRAKAAALRARRADEREGVQRFVEQARKATPAQRALVAGRLQRVIESAERYGNFSDVPQYKGRAMSLPRLKETLRKIRSL